MSSLQKQIKNIVLVSGGNCLDMYDFMVFGYYAPWISKAYFPSGNDVNSLLLTFAVFGAGFLMRPLGALVLGAYVDRHGRRKGLVMTLSLMAIGTISIAFTPSYATLGILAPILVLLGRLLQGFSAGAQLGSVSVYLAEIATPGNKGFYVSWQSASQQVAVVFASVVGVALNSLMPASTFASWGWRLPFMIGCLLLPFVFLIHKSLEETPAFLIRKKPLSAMQVFRSLTQSWQIILVGMLLVSMTTVAFYLITAYSPTYGHLVLHLTPRDGLLVTLCVGLLNFMMLPIMGALSDRIGRRPILITCTVLMLITCYPAMRWLDNHASFRSLLIVDLWLALLYSSYNGAMVVYLTEIIPSEVRTAGFSVAYSLATAIFGGFTPAASTYLIQLTGNRAMPGAWLSLAAACALVAVMASRVGSRANMLRHSVVELDL